MKQINTYINEKLHLTTKNTYTCQPKNKHYLRDIIMVRIDNEGNECDLNDIDTSKITDMFGLFDGFSEFNCNISMWNVSNVENMCAMFNGCTKFNCDLSMWDVSNVKDIAFMFNRCYKFKCDLSKWDVSNVKAMENAFNRCPTTPDWYDRKRWDLVNITN